MFIWGRVCFASPQKTKTTDKLMRVIWKNRNTFRTKTYTRKFKLCVQTKHIYTHTEQLRTPTQCFRFFVFLFFTVRVSYFCDFGNFSSVTIQCECCYAFVLRQNCFPQKFYCSVFLFWLCCSLLFSLRFVHFRFECFEQSSISMSKRLENKKKNKNQRDFLSFNELRIFTGS